MSGRFGTMKWPILLRRKPTTIRAMRWTGENYSDLKAWGAPVSFLGGGEKMWLWVEANRVQIPVDEGEWIAKDELGYYPIKDEMVLKNYELVEDVE